MAGTICYALPLMDDRLPIGKAFRVGWEATKKNFLFLLGLYALFYMVQFGATVAIAFLAGDNENLAAGLGAFLNIVSNAIFGTGTAAVSLKLCDSLKPSLGDFICEGKVLLFYFLGFLLLTPLLIAGFLLLIVPGVYLALRFSQFVYFVVEQKDNPIDALKNSWEATRGMALDLMVYFFAVVALVFAGFLLLIVGIIPAWFVSMIASAFIYRFLNRRRVAGLAAQKDPSTPSPVLVE